MKRLFIILFYAFSICVISMTSSSADELDYMRISIEAKKKVKIAEYLNLTSEEDDFFWDIYSDYEKEIEAIRRDHFQLIKDYSDAYRSKTVTNEKAEKYLTQYLSIEESKINVKKRYADEFKKALTRKKIMRFFQIDNKIESIISHDITNKIPLVK